MQALTRALYERLVADEAMAAVLPSYRGAPSVFASRLVPDDAPFPRVHVRPPVSEVPWNTTDRKGWEVLQDIAVYAKDSGSEAPIDAVAEQARDLLADVDHPLRVPGWSIALLRTSLSDLPDDEVGYTGRLVGVRVLLQKD